MNSSPHRYIILVLGLIALAGCKRKEHPVRHAESVPVQITTVRKAEITLPYFASGTVQAKDYAILSAKVSGTITESYLQLGHAVKKGDLLVRIRAEEFASRVAQAQTEVAKLERDYHRESELLKKQISTTQTVRDLADALESAKARLTEAETMVSYLEIKAPFDGFISAENVRVGDLTNPGQPLGELTNTNVLQVVFAIPDSLPMPKQNESLEVKIGSRTESGTITEIAPNLDIRTRTRTFKLNLPPDTDATVGQFVRISVPSSPQTVLLIPESSLSRQGQIERVFVIQDGILRMRIIRTTAKVSTQERVVASGLTEGEHLVRDFLFNLKDGQTVIP